MPMYNVLCPSCGHEEEKFTTYSDFTEHSSRETPITCSACNQQTAFYSLSRLSENLKAVYTNVSNFYPSGESEKWYRGLNDLGNL